MSIQPAAGVTIAQLQRMRAEGEKIACLTAYDAAFARLLDQAGMDVILVGDSLGMVIQGKSSTVSVSIHDMIYHTACVSRATDHALVIADMPFMSYRNIDRALQNAARLIQQGGAQMVKLEATRRQTEIVTELSACGIAVCAHLGLRPQYIHKSGGYHMQGADAGGAEQLRRAARALEQAGADMLLVECIPATLAADITRMVSIPVIGIGAGRDCGGQILVLQDMLGITPGRTPSFAKNYLPAESIQTAIKHYIDEVKSGRFPRQ